MPPDSGSHFPISVFVAAYDDYLGIAVTGQHCPAFAVFVVGGNKHILDDFKIEVNGVDMRHFGS